jgi:hypothetical protein
MTRRKTPRSDLPVLLLWLLVGYLVYRADPSATEVLQEILEGAGRFLQSVMAWY